MGKYQKKPGRKNQNCISEVPFDVIQSAKDGDPISMKMVIDNFRPLINRLSVRGNYSTGYYIDPLISLQLESELMRAIIYKF